MNSHHHLEEKKQESSTALTALSHNHNHDHQKHLSPVVDALLKIFEDDPLKYRDETKYQVSRTVSLLAALYEKARNAIEFKEEHLIRRSAIERIIKRRLILGEATNTIGENVIMEILWARYIDSSDIDDDIVATVQKIIDKYLVVKQGILNGKHDIRGVSWETLLGILAAEIEEAIIPAKKRESLNNFYFQAIESKVNIPNIDEKTKSILLYIAVERAYAQSDDPIITFHLIKLLQPSWLTTTPQLVNQELQELLDNITLIQKALKHPLSDTIYRHVRKYNPPFLLLRDFLLENGRNSRTIIQNPHEFEETLRTLATKRYKDIGTKVRRAVIRSIIYIFLTKMIFAIALEAPVDIFIAKRIDYLALSINIVFPPFLLFLIAGFIQVPGKENTEKLIRKISMIIYSFDEFKQESHTSGHQNIVKKQTMNTTFRILYVLAFLLSFGFISFILTKLHFNIASQLIFIFFVTLVSFFAYRIRLSAKEYQIVEKPGVLTPIIDFFFIPILSVGRTLSGEIAKLNVLMLIFDFILEAPLKVILEFMEEWFRFIRRKKEELI
ncbi:MAG: hypothetical protein N3A54_03560 [Patescibacteria group bacterium]|nr:hypothetical protein [Patescibacteria group bacterium]